MRRLGETQSRPFHSYLRLALNFIQSRSIHLSVGLSFTAEIKIHTNRKGQSILFSTHTKLHMFSMLEAFANELKGSFIFHYF